MVEKYDVEVRLSVLRLWFLGLKLEDIASQLKVSIGSVRNFVEELKDGKYPEFEGFLPYLEGMRYMAKQMAANSLGLPQAVTGLTLFNALVQLGLDPKKLLEFFRILQRIAPEDFPQKEFVRAILRIAELEKETGFSYEQLEARASTLRIEIPELEAAKKVLVDQISSLQASATEEQKNLDQTLEAKKVTLQLLENYEHDVAVLTDAGFKIEDVKRLTDFLTKAVDEGYAAAAIELAELEKQTGKNYDMLLVECKRAVAEAEVAKLELPKAQGELRKLNDEIIKRKKEMEEELKSYKITRDQLKRHTNILRGLATIGVDFEQLDSLRQLLSNVTKLGWTARSVVICLKSISDLDEAKRTRENELATITSAIAGAKNTLESLTNQIAVVKAERDKLVDYLSKLKSIIAQLTMEESAKRKHIELVDSFIQLLRDPSKLSVDQLSALMLELQSLIVALMRPESLIYPPDFQPIRNKVLELFETVLAKEYVPKEDADAARKRLGDQNTDLLLDKLGKMEHQRLNIEEERAEVQKEKDDAAQLTRRAVTMTKETALKLVADLGARSYTCYLCSSTFTICLGTTVCNEPKICPSCGAPLIHSVQQFR